MTPEGQAAIEILVATLGGAAVGVERQWSGHATGAHARFAGIRTFTLMGSLAGTAGWLSSLGDAVSAAVLLTGGVALVVAAYVAASRREVDGTTEVASLVVLVAGFVAGVGHLALASGIFAATSLILVEKSRLHAFVARLSDAEMRAAARFAVMAVVVLPLLPEGPYGPLGGIRPRELWALVLFFSALSFAAYVARRAAGAGRGDAVAGLLGGLISSTSVTLGFSRTSRARTADTPALALGVLAACTVMYLRVLLTTAVLNPGLAVVLAPALAAPFLAGALAVAIGARRIVDRDAGQSRDPNPLQFTAALQMAGLFQVVLFAVSAVRAAWGDLGLLLSGLVLGLTDIDALTLSMAKSVSAGAALGSGARAIVLGTLSNTLLKLVIAATIGGPGYRRRVVLGLAAVTLATLGSLALLR